LSQATPPAATLGVLSVHAETAVLTASVIECRRVSKVFGRRAPEALAAIGRDGLDRADMLARFQCVLAVADVSFTVGAGEVFCIMGLSGSGKSTLVRHVNRLIEPSAGEILIQGEDIGRKSSTELRRLRSEKIGMVFQHVAIFPHRTVRDNVAFGLEIRGVDRNRRRAVADDKLALVQLAGWGERYPDELSGGMQQRVGLARALAADPDILLMDEPFSALDPLIRRELQNEFIQLSSAMRKTTLFITHDLEEAIRLGDRIAIMKDGRFVQVGTPEEIVTAPADDYVASFVRGVSRLPLLKAIAFIDVNEKPPSIDSAWPRVGAATALQELLDHAVISDAPIVVCEPGGDVLGFITRRSLLDGIRGRVPAREGALRRAAE
jgi:glycine betaine/proline transport system ATP-binding protein